MLELRGHGTLQATGKTLHGYAAVFNSEANLGTFSEVTLDEAKLHLRVDHDAVGTVWASVQPLKGREYLAAQAAQSEVTTRITMRYRPGVTPDLKVTHEGRQYEIESVIDTNSRGVELVLMCRG